MRKAAGCFLVNEREKARDLPLLEIRIVAVLFREVMCVRQQVNIVALKRNEWFLLHHVIEKIRF
jgi:hypothetical protein